MSWYEVEIHEKDGNKMLVGFSAPARPSLPQEIDPQDPQKIKRWRRQVDYIKQGTTIDSSRVSSGIAGMTDLFGLQIRWHCLEGFSKYYLDNEGKRNETRWYPAGLHLVLPRNTFLDKTLYYPRAQNLYRTYHEEILSAIFEVCQGKNVVR